MCSMISGQCDKLRKTADEIQRIKNNNADWLWRDAITLDDAVEQMRYAADLILELRDGLQRSNDENARLRESLEFANNEWEKDSLEYLNLQAENAKLRELVRLMVRRHTLTRTCMDIPCGECPAKDECDQEDALMRELGVEA